MNNNKYNDNIVTILIPHYQTHDSIRLCLRSIRRYTPKEQCKVRVLDNGSKDSSIKYIKELSWIDLEETNIENNTWTAHFKSLNKAIKNIDTPYFLIMHSDTYIHRDGWLNYLITKLEKDNAVCIGSRQQTIPVLTGLSIYRRFRSLRKKYCTDNVPRIRSLCALYKTTVFQEVNAEFYTSKNHEDITYKANKQLVDAGNIITSLRAGVMGKYIFHKGDTTQIVNKTFEYDKSKHDSAHAAFLARKETQIILNDKNLDY